MGVDEMGSRRSGMVPMKLYSNVFEPHHQRMNKVLFRPHDRSHQAVAPKFTVSKSNDSYLQHVL